LLRKHRLAGLAAALYVANPAALYDVAHWGQPDGAHSLFAVLSIGALVAGQDALGWGSMALAALAKPQAWSLLPLVAIATLRLKRPLPRLALDAVVALLVSLVVVLPFLLTGHVRDLLSLPGTISSVMPVVSADAHNLWWLVFAPHSEDALTLLDTQRLLGPLTFRAVAGLLVLAALGGSYWLYWTRRAGLAEAAALGALGWFVFTTQAHENHLFFALPLLALAWLERRALLVVFGILSLTLLLNMVLHDQLVLESLGLEVEDRSVRLLRVFNAGLNVLTWLGWTGWAVLRPLPADQRVASTFRVKEGHIVHA
jgi:Gpi18-like mannosyltransferase